MSSSPPLEKGWLRAAWTGEFMAGVILPALVLPTAFNSGVNLLYLLGSFLLAYMLLAVFLGLWNLSPIEVELPASIRIEEDQCLPALAKLENPSRFPSFDLTLFPSLPRGELTASWSAFQLSAQESLRPSSHHPCPRRGAFHFSSYYLESRYPIAFMRTRRRFTRSSGDFRLVVLPRLLAVDFEEAFGSDQMLEGEDLFQHGAKGGTTFYGVRPYQVGDPIKHIHWKSSAKTDRLMLKEFQQPLQARYYLFLDLDQDQLEGEAEHANLEYLIRLAASLGHFLLSRRAQFHYVWFDPQSQSTRVSPPFSSPADLDEARELLAGLKFHPGSQTRTMLQDAVSALQPGNRLVFFVPRDQESVPHDAAGSGFPSKAIFLVQSQSSPHPPPPGNEGETGLAGAMQLYRYDISKDRIEADLG